MLHQHILLVLSDSLYAQYHEPRFLLFKKYLLFFFSLQFKIASYAANIADSKKYFTSPDPFFVMYDAFCQSFIITTLNSGISA